MILSLRLGPLLPRIFFKSLREGKTALELEKKKILYAPPLSSPFPCFPVCSIHLHLKTESVKDVCDISVKLLFFSFIAPEVVLFSS